MKGIVIKSTGSWYDLLDADGKRYKGRLQGKFKIQGLKTTNPIAVGDEVEFEYGGDESVIINTILPRKNYLIRKSVHKSHEGHLIASNLDQTLLVVTLAFPRTSLGFIDRFLVSSEAFGIPALLIFNKVDLYDDELRKIQEELAETYAKLHYKSIRTSVITGEGIEELRKVMNGKKSLFSGHSGVGKSSLLNTIAPQYSIKTSEVSEFANKGVHTTTFAEMYELGNQTYIIDTPGIKELGVFEIGEAELSHYFPEMAELLGQCKFHNCKHINEPKCAVIEKVKKGEIALSRYQSYMSILMNEESHR
jgi:ribosome biogenesis GTPase / thiamine phosphate phosphatase